MRRRMSLITHLVTTGLSVFLVGHAFAFSQFEGEKGSFGSGKGGIIAVPLPPLPGSEPDRAGPNLPAVSPKTTEPVEPARHRNGPAPTSGANPHQDDLEGTDEGETPIAPEEDGNPLGTGAVKPVEKPAPTLQPRPEGDPSSAPVQYQSEPSRPGTDGTGPRVGKPFAAPASPSQGDPAVPLASEIGHGADKLSPAVRDIRQKLLDAARTGDIEALRPLIATGEDGTVLSFGDTPKDPIDFLKSASGDGAGIEILAILVDILQSGYARVEADTDDEIYVWPYFTQVDLSRLSKPQLVELFQIVTAGDYQSMAEFGAYNFYRIGITPDGKLQFFVAGD